MSTKSRNASSRSRQPAVGLLGRRQRQRALRAEHAEKPRLEANDGRTGRSLAAVDVRVRKLEIRVFAERRRTRRRAFVAIADARLARILPLEPAQHGEEGRTARARPRSSARNVTDTPRSPMRGGQRMISPRSSVRTTVWVKWLIATYSAKNRSRTAPSRNAPEPSKAFSSRTTRDLEAARRRGAFRLPQPPHDRLARRGCARRGSCDRSRCRRGRRTGSSVSRKRLGPVASARSTSPR